MVGSAPHGRTQASRWSLLPLMLTPVLSGLAVTGPMPILADMSRHFATTPGAATLVRMTLTAVGAAMIVGAPLAALLSERFGERTVLIVALAVYALVGAAGGFIPNLHVLVAMRLLLGLALAATGVTTLTLLSRLVPPAQRNRWIGFVSLAGALGTVMILPVAGYLGSIDWRLMFLMHLIALPMLLLVLALIPRSTPHAPVDATAPARPSGFPAKLILLGLACGAVSTTLSIYIPFHLTAIGETDPSRIAIPLTAGLLTGSAMALAFGWIRNHIGAAPLFVFAFSIVALMLALVSFSHHMEIIAIFMLLNGIGTGVLAPNLFSLAAEGDAERRSRRIGLARMGYFGAPLLAQLPLEPVTMAYGAAGALLALAGASAMIALLILIVRRRIAPA